MGYWEQERRVICQLLFSTTGLMTEGQLMLALALALVLGVFLGRVICSVMNFTGLWGMMNNCGVLWYTDIFIRQWRWRKYTLYGYCRCYPRLISLACVTSHFFQWYRFVAIRTCNNQISKVGDDLQIGLADFGERSHGTAGGARYLRC